MSFGNIRSLTEAPTLDLSAIVSRFEESQKPEVVDYFYDKIKRRAQVVLESDACLMGDFMTCMYLLPTLYQKTFFLSFIERFKFQGRMRFATLTGEETAQDALYTSQICDNSHWSRTELETPTFLVRKISDYVYSVEEGTVHNLDRPGGPRRWRRTRQFGVVVSETAFHPIQFAGVWS